MQEPVNVKTCLHKFCSKCINDYIRIEKKECPTCRTSIGSRRMLRRDEKLKQIIDTLIPNLDSFRQYEQEEVQRNIKALNKNDEYKKKLAEIQKIRERQIRNEIEERKDNKPPKIKPIINRRPEPKVKPTIQRERERSPQSTDRKFRQTKRQKIDEVPLPINVKFKLKQLQQSSKGTSNQNPEKLIIQKKIIDTNDEITLRHLAQYIKLSSGNQDLNINSIAFYVKNSMSKFEKIESTDTMIKEVSNEHWNKGELNSLYFLC